VHSELKTLNDKKIRCRHEAIIVIKEAFVESVQGKENTTKIE